MFYSHVGSYVCCICAINKNFIRRDCQCQCSSVTFINNVTRKQELTRFFFLTNFLIAPRYELVTDVYANYPEQSASVVAAPRYFLHEATSRFRKGL